MIQVRGGEWVARVRNGAVGVCALTLACLISGTLARAQEDAAPAAEEAEAAAPAEGEAPAEDEAAEDLGWTGKVVLGASLATGDVDAFSGHFEAGAERKWKKDVLRFGLNAIYGVTDGDENADAQAATSDWRHFFTERVYSYVDGEFGRDSIQEIQWRFITNAGPGWRVWMVDDKRHLDLETGVGYRHEEYDNDTPTRDDVNIRFAFEHANVLGPVLEMVHTAEFLLPANDPEGFLARTNLTLAVPIGAGWHFSNSVGLEYLNEPAEGNEEVNIKATSGLEYRF